MVSLTVRSLGPVTQKTGQDSRPVKTDQKQANWKWSHIPWSGFWDGSQFWDWLTGQNRDHWKPCLQPLERGDGLAADVVVLVLEPLEHVVVDLLVELVVDRRVLAHQLQEAVDQQADPEPGLRGLDLVVVEQPVEQLVKNRREVLREETLTSC